MLSKNLISTVTPISAAATENYWIATLGGGAADTLSSGTVDAEGNVYIVGYTSNNDVLLAKYDTFGTIQWQRSLGGDSVEQGFGIAVDPSGNVYICGMTGSQSAGSFDLLIAKYNPSGVIQWQRTLGGTGEEQGYAIAVDTNGDVYVTGYTISPGGAGSNDLLIAKYNTSGVIQWQRSLGGTAIETGNAIAVDTSGNVYVTGRTTSVVIGNNYLLLTKYDTSGTIQWQRSLGPAHGYGITTDSSGNVYIVGSADSTALIAKYDTSGVIQWQRTLGAATTIAYGVALDASGNIYVSGSSTVSGGAGLSDIHIAKYDTSGTIQWQRSLGGTGDDTGRSIYVDTYGNMYVIARTASQGAGGNDILIAKLPATGSPTGDYGNLSYRTRALIDRAGTGSAAATTFTSTTRTLTDAARTLTDTATTLTSTTTTIPIAYWIATLGGAGDDRGYGIAVDSSGNSYIVGYTESQGAGGQDVLIAKYNTSGAIEWQRSLGGAVSDQGWGIAVDASGNVYVAGQTASQTAGSNDVLITKYDTSGTIQWQQSLGGASDDQGYGITVDASGNVYLTGNTLSGGAGSADVLIAKYSTAGQNLWYRSLGGSSVDTAFGVAVDASGNVYVAGYTFSQSAGIGDVLIAKYNTTGVIQWQRRLGGTNTDSGYGIAVDASGNVYVAGYTQSQGAGSIDVLIAKYDTSGTIQWQRLLGGASEDYSFGIAIDASGNIYVTGQTSSQGAGSFDVLIAKYDTSGNIKWQRRLGGSGADVGRGIAIDASGNLYVTGITQSQSAGSNDVLIAKLPASGELTGTYGSFTYATSTLTAATSTLTAATTTLVSATPALTYATTTLTDTATTLTSSTTTIQTGA